MGDLFYYIVYSFLIIILSYNSIPLFVHFLL